MTTKHAIIATVGILLVAFVLGLVVLFWLVESGAKGVNERAELLGQGLGILCFIPLGIIWGIWAKRFRKERDRK